MPYFSFRRHSTINCSNDLVSAAAAGVDSGECRDDFTGTYRKRERCYELVRFTRKTWKTATRWLTRSTSFNWVLFMYSFFFSISFCFIRVNGSSINFRSKSVLLWTGTSFLVDFMTKKERKKKTSLKLPSWNRKGLRSEVHLQFSGELSLKQFLSMDRPNKYSSGSTSVELFLYIQSIFAR